jgi:hypothetical protein
MPEIPHLSRAASMILPFSQASARSSHGISAFLLVGQVWVGATDGQNESFQGHYPDADVGASRQRRQARVHDDANASPADATTSDAPVAGIGALFRSRSLVGTNVSDEFLVLAVLHGVPFTGQFSDRSRFQTVPGHSYVAYLQDVDPLYLATSRGSKSDSGPCSLRESPEGLATGGSKRHRCLGRRRAGTPQLPSAA